MKLAAIAVLLVLAGVAGSALQSWHDHDAITQARQSEAQANGLEDQCKATLGKIVEDAANNPNNPDNEQEEK